MTYAIVSLLDYGRSKLVAYMSQLSEIRHHLQIQVILNHIGTVVRPAFRNYSAVEKTIADTHKSKDVSIVTSAR